MSRRVAILEDEQRNAGRVRTVRKLESNNNKTIKRPVVYIDDRYQREILNPRTG